MPGLERLGAATWHGRTARQVDVPADDDAAVEDSAADRDADRADRPDAAVEAARREDGVPGEATGSCTPSAASSCAVSVSHSSLASDSASALSFPRIPIYSASCVGWSLEDPTPAESRT